MLMGVNIDLMKLSAPAKRGYHHGDLRNALAESAAQLAREGGPESVTVRAAARLAGVTPTAAYRHYAGHEELLAEAKHQCLHQLGETIERELRAQPALPDPVHNALRNLATAGRTYIEFALAEPGLFRTAFSQGGAILDRPVEDRNTTFAILVALLDELVAVGFLAAEHRPMAEVAAWSACHGLAMLLLDGPLRDVPQPVKDEAIGRTLLAVGRGFGTGKLTPELERVVLDAAGPGSPPPARHPG
jgi:AcrR family transcriptional regulator